MDEHLSASNGNGRSRGKLDWNFIPAQFIAHEIKPNVKRHHSEISENDGSPEPNIDWDTYEQASHAGICWALTVRDKGVLVGYAIYTLSRNLRYMHIVEATSSGWYVEKKYKGIGLEMPKRAEEYLKNLGVHETHYILSGSRVGGLLERQQYKPKYTVWSKQIDG